MNADNKPSPERISPRITVEQSGLKSLAVEHGLLFDAAESLKWLRACRTATKATVQANLPIVVMTGSLFEALFARCLHELVHARQGSVNDAELLAPLTATREAIEAGDIWATRWLGTAKEVFPFATHPQTHAYLSGPASEKLRRLFDLRNIAAHASSVWADFRLPVSPAEPLKFVGVRRQQQQLLIKEITASGFSIEAAEGVSGLTELFSRTDIIDSQCQTAWDFLKQLAAWIKADSNADGTAFSNCGILWPDFAEAMVGRREFL